MKDRTDALKHCHKVSWLAPAKLNLFLHINGKRGDGYHNLQTFFQLLDYGDQLQFVPRNDNQILAQYQITGVDRENDLILRAARLLLEYGRCKNLIKKEQHLGVDIYLEKKLPMGGGLGGGSSDAATTLKALNQLWQLNLETDELAALGLSLGADVPVFVHGKNCWAEGVGEQIQPMESSYKDFLVIVPEFQIATTKLFAHPLLRKDYPMISPSQWSMDNTENAFETIVRKDYPQINHIFEVAAQLNSLYPPRLTGTGACLFLLFSNRQQCLQAQAALEKNYHCFTARALLPEHLVKHETQTSINQRHDYWHLSNSRAGK